MNAFEKWQVFNGLIGNMLLLGTLIIAGYIGLQQMEISAQQTQINKQLLSLEYEISIDLEYDREAKALILSNRSKHNIYFGGARFDGTGHLEESPRLIPIGSKHEIRPPQDFEELAPLQGGSEEEVELCLMDERRQKYLLRCEVSTRNRDGKLFSIDIRKGAPEKGDW